MAITTTLPDTDLGTDINLVSDLAGVWGLASGATNLINSQLRRLSTPRGGLFYDLDYGYDVLAALNSAVTPVDVARIKAAIPAELRKDPRVLSVRADVVFVFATKTMTITISEDTALGPFELVLAASGVTVDLLSVNGVAVAQTASAANTTVVVGPVGPAGPAGPAGATGSGGSGGAQAILDDPRTMASTLGSEEVVFQWDGVDFGALPVGSITGEFMASVLSAAGMATFRLRVGGSDGVADGTVIATITHALGSFQTKNASGTFTNPTGLQYVKITIASSGAGVDARVKGPVVTFR